MVNDDPTEWTYEHWLHSAHNGNSRHVSLTRHSELRKRLLEFHKACTDLTPISGDLSYGHFDKQFEKYFAYVLKEEKEGVEK